jgi:hypothetical protein
MAMHWLDLARYADTNGYNNDETRTMWPWRDWVIAAFTEGMPYDQFLTEQLAGDLLPNASLSQKVATGFNRNHVLTTEGGGNPLPAPAATVVGGAPTVAATLAAGQIELTFPTVTGVTYRVEARSSLGGGTWTPEGTAVVGNGSAASVKLSTSDDAKFFRVTVQ